MKQIGKTEVYNLECEALVVLNKKVIHSLLKAVSRNTIHTRHGP